MPQTPSAASIYNALISHNHGFPMLTPEPNENLPGEYQQLGVSIGDVAIWRNGALEPLFNACWAENYSINAHCGVPSGFVPFELDKSAVSKRMYYHCPGSIVTTARICEVSVGAGASSVIPSFVPATAGSSVELSFKSGAGAVLVLPEGASREELLPVERFRAYVERQAAEWYAFAHKSGYLPRRTYNGRGDSVGELEDGLFVVTGCDKTSAWGIATAHSMSASVGFSAKLALVGLVEGTLEPKFEWKQAVSATVRTSAPSGSGSDNQCVFVRGFFIPRPAKETALEKCARMAARFRGGSLRRIGWTKGSNGRPEEEKGE